MYNCFYLLGSSLFGYFTHFLLNCFCCLSGQKAVNYYAEVHTTKQNIVCHIIGMPFTILGMTLWIPPIFNYIGISDYWLVQWSLFMYYLGHYVKVNLDTSVYFCFMYYPVVYIGNMMYIGGTFDIIRGLLISIFALVFQEVIGHNLGNDPPSRPEGVLNAIFYAKYFSANSFKKFIRYKIIKA